VDPSRDLATVVDGLEPVTLHRRDGTMLGLPHALRRPLFSRRGSGNTPPSRVADVRWHIPSAECPVPLQPGDALVDRDQARWTILEAKLISLDGRWMCTCCDLAVAFGLDTVISVLRADDAASTAGTAVAPWHTWRTGVAARIEAQPDDVAAAIATNADPLPGPRLFRIVVAEPLVLDSRCRVRALDGTLYRVTGYLPAQHAGQLDRIDVELI